MPEKEIKGIKKFFEEFKAFAMRGNVLDMAVGVVIGGAFTAIVTALVDDVINPLIGLFFKADFSDVVISLGGSSIQDRRIRQLSHQLPHRGLCAVCGDQVHQRPAQEAGSSRRTGRAHHQGVPLLPDRDSPQGCALPALHLQAGGLPGDQCLIPQLLYLKKAAVPSGTAAFFAVSVRCGACRRPNATAARHTGSSPPAGPRPTGRKHTPAGGTPQRRGTAPR